jgi:hypothetical protein
MGRKQNDLPDLLTSCPILAVSWSSILGQGDSPGSQSSQTGIFGTAVEPILGGLTRLEVLRGSLHKNSSSGSGVGEVSLLTKNVVVSWKKRGSWSYSLQISKDGSPCLTLSERPLFTNGLRPSCDSCRTCHTLLSFSFAAIAFLCGWEFI